VKDETEREVFRGDALESIYLLDEKAGKKPARQHQDKTDCPGSAAREIMQIKNRSIYRKEQKKQTCHPDT
jgi:hypothetical protein